MTDEATKSTQASTATDVAYDPESDTYYIVPEHGVWYNDQYDSTSAPDYVEYEDF